MKSRESRAQDDDEIECLYTAMDSLDNVSSPTSKTAPKLNTTPAAPLRQTKKTISQRRPISCPISPGDGAGTTAEGEDELDYSYTATRLGPDGDWKTQSKPKIPRPYSTALAAGGGGDIMTSENAAYTSTHSRPAKLNAATSTTRTSGADKIPQRNVTAAATGGSDDIMTSENAAYTSTLSRPVKLSIANTATCSTVTVTERAQTPVQSRPGSPTNVYTAPPALKTDTSRVSALAQGFESKIHSSSDKKVVKSTSASNMV